MTSREPDPQAPANGDDEKTKLDRELDELLSELRVTLPGVQVLFAFLLILPFSQGFGRVDGLQRSAYFLAFLSTTVSSVLLIAPTPYHRLRWREHDKEQLLRTANRLTIVGTALLATAMTAVVFVITDVLYGRPASGFVAAIAAATFGFFWYGLALFRRLGRGGRRKEEP